MKFTSVWSLAFVFIRAESTKKDSDIAPDDDLVKAGVVDLILFENWCKKLLLTAAPFRFLVSFSPQWR